MKNRPFQEDHARDCQEIEELRSICCEEPDRARQARIDELSMHQERNPTTVSQLLTQIQELQNKVNSLSDAREFYDPESGSSSGATHVPSQPPTILSPRTVPRCDSGLPRNKQNCMGTSGNVFERPPAQEGPSSAHFENSLNLASSSCGLGQGTTGNILGHGGRVRKGPQSSAIPSHVFFRVATLISFSHTGGTYCHSRVIDHPRFPISELHLGKIS